MYKIYVENLINILIRYSELKLILSFKIAGWYTQHNKKILHIQSTTRT